MTEAAPLPIDDVPRALRSALAGCAARGAWAKATRLVLLEPCRISTRAAFFNALYVNIGAMPGSAFAIARRYAGRSLIRSR